MSDHNKDQRVEELDLVEEIEKLLHSKALSEEQKVFAQQKALEILDGNEKGVLK